MVVIPQEEALSDLLRRWHLWHGAYQYGRGYPSKAAGCSDWRASRQYDDINGSLDTNQEHEQLEIVGFEVEQMPEPGRTALYVNARALALNLSVFKSPRLPEDQAQTLGIISRARDELARRLVKRGVL